jgi:hypothetical protein
MAMLAIANPVSGDAGFWTAPSYLWATRRATQRLLKVDGDLDVHLASSVIQVGERAASGAAEGRRLHEQLDASPLQSASLAFLGRGVG